METGIDASLFPYRDCLLPYDNLTLMDPSYHMGIPIWKWGLTHPYVIMDNHRFHVGIEKFGLPVSIWESPYGNGDDGSPFPYGDYPVPKPFP